MNLFVAIQKQFPMMEERFARQAAEQIDREIGYSAAMEAAEEVQSIKAVAVELFHALRDSWKVPDVDAMTLYLSAILAGIAEKWKEAQPENGFVHASVFPGIGKLEIDIHRVNGKSAAEEICELRAEIAALRVDRGHEKTCELCGGTGEERSGVCHCGSEMEGHSVYDNHAPVEMTRRCESCNPQNQGFESPGRGQGSGPLPGRDVTVVQEPGKTKFVTSPGTPPSSEPSTEKGQA